MYEMVRLIAIAIDEKECSYKHKVLELESMYNLHSSEHEKDKKLE